MCTYTWLYNMLLYITQGVYIRILLNYYHTDAEVFVILTDMSSYADALREAIFMVESRN